VGRSSAATTRQHGRSSKRACDQPRAGRIHRRLAWRVGSPGTEGREYARWVASYYESTTLRQFRNGWWAIGQALEDLAALGEEAFAAAWAAGRALSLDEAVTYALDEMREG
jgi:hypothetical protein